jgi:hypothetical protein
LKKLRPSIKAFKGKSPKMPLRALKKSYCEQPKAPPTYFLSTTFSGCLQEPGHVYSAIDPNSLPLVRVDFLSMPVLLQRADLLQ